MATAGPIPMMSGGQPTTAYPRTTPNTLSPRLEASDRRAIRTAAAPSLTWLELPVQREIGATCTILKHEITTNIVTFYFQDIHNKT